MLLGHGAVRIDARGGNQDRARRILALADLSTIDLEDRSVDELNRVAFGFTTGDVVSVPAKYFSDERPFTVSDGDTALLRHDGSLVPLTAELAGRLESATGEDVTVRVRVEADPVATIYLLAQELRRWKNFRDDPERFSKWYGRSELFLHELDEKNPGAPVLLSNDGSRGRISPWDVTGFYHVTTSLRALRASALKSRLQLLRESDPSFILPKSSYHRSLAYPVVGLGGSSLDRLPDMVSTTYSLQRALKLQEGIGLAVRCAQAQGGVGEVDPLEILDFVLELHGLEGGVERAVKDRPHLYDLYAAYLFVTGIDEDLPVPFVSMISEAIESVPDPVQRRLLLEYLVDHGVRRGYLNPDGSLVEEDGDLSVEEQWKENGDFRMLPYGETERWLEELLEWWNDSLSANEPIDPDILLHGRSSEAWVIESFVEETRGSEYETLSVLDSWLGRLTGELGIESPRIGFLAQLDAMQRCNPNDVGIVTLQVRAGAEPIVALAEWELTFSPSDVRLYPYPEIERAASGAPVFTRYQVSGFVRVLVDEMGGDAVAINAGLCEEFAETLADRLGPGAHTRCAELDSTLRGHCWVQYLGRSYDSETPMGADHPWQLNSYRRWNVPDRATWYG